VSILVKKKNREGKEIKKKKKKIKGECEKVCPKSHVEMIARTCWIPQQPQFPFSDGPIRRKRYTSF
jgi:hypothetical protein